MNNFEKNFIPYTLYFTLFLLPLHHNSQFTIHSSQFDPLSLQLVGLPEQELSPKGRLPPLGW